MTSESVDPFAEKVLRLVELKRGRQLLGGLRLIADPSPEVLEVIEAIERIVDELEEQS